MRVTKTATTCAWKTSRTSETSCRETRLFQVVPISTNLILSYVAERVVFGRPRSF